MQQYTDRNRIGWLGDRRMKIARKQLLTRGTSSLSVLRLPVENFE